MQCHCYVCDALAPCLHWGTGLLDTDHCHATDKDRKWKQQREHLRLLKSASHTVSKSVDSSLSEALPHLNQTAEFDYAPQQNQVLHIVDFDQVPQLNQISPIRPIHLDQNSSSRVQFSKQPEVYPSSFSTNVGVPNITRENGSQSQGYSVARNRVQRCSVVPEYHQNSSFRRHRVHNTGILRPHLISSRTAFKVAGNYQSSLRKTQFMHRPVHHIRSSPGSQYHGNHRLTTGSNIRNTNANAGSSQSEFYGDPISQSNGSTHNFQHGGNQTLNTVGHNSQNDNHLGNQPNRHPTSNRIFQHGVQTQNPAVHHPSGIDLGWEGNISQTNEQPATEDIQLLGETVTNQGSTVDNFYVPKSSSVGSLADSQQLCSQTIQQVPADSLHTFQWSDSPPVSNSLYCHSQSNFQSPTEDFHLRSTEPFSEPLPTDFNSHQPVATSSSSGLYVESLMFENSSDPVTSDFPDPSEMTIFSPDRTALDPADLSYFTF